MSQEEFFAWQEKQDKLYELVDGHPVLPLKMIDGRIAGARPRSW